MTAMPTLPRSRQIPGWCVSGLLALLFVYSAVEKFVWAADGPMSVGLKRFTHYGLENKLILIGSGELLGSVLFLIPRTAAFGTLVLSAHIGGAIATHMEHGENFAFQSIVLVLVWFTQWLRHPKLFNHA